MERVPTQTDLSRLCDAIEKFSHYVQSRRASVQGMDERTEELKKLILVLPVPRYFTVSFDGVGRPYDPPAVEWRGWNEKHWQTFLETIEACRAVILAWWQVHVDSEYSLKPLQTVHAHPDGKSTELLDSAVRCSRRLRELCSFTPCEEQNDILNALVRKSLTADELEKECNISRSRLYGRRANKDIGGLNELVRLDFVRNGANDGSGISGYYRPDSPPE